MTELAFCFNISTLVLRVLKGELMVKNVDYDSRRRAVLSAAINRHIHDAEPVASDDIADEFDLSSATIRNIFVELENSGFLTHSHTSGGRIPTDKGYRYYVDSLVSQIELLDAEKERITREYQHQMRRLDEALERTSEVVSVITHYAGIVSFLDWHDRLFYKGISSILEQPEFQSIEKMRILMKMIEDKQNLLDIINRDTSDKVQVYIGSELGCPGMQNCSLVVSSFQIKHKPSGRLAVLGPARMEYRKIIPTLEYVSEVLNEVLDEF